MLLGIWWFQCPVRALQPTLRFAPIYGTIRADPFHKRCPRPAPDIDPLHGRSVGLGDHEGILGRPILPNRAGVEQAPNSAFTRQRTSPGVWLSCHTAVHPKKWDQIPPSAQVEDGRNVDQFGVRLRWADFPSWPHDDLLGRCCVLPSPCMEAACDGQAWPTPRVRLEHVYLLNSRRHD